MRSFFDRLNKKYVVEVIVIIIIVLSVINYRRINEEPPYTLTEMDAHFSDAVPDFGEDMISTGSSGCIYYLKKPKTEIRYSKFYKQNVFRYIIPFTAKNVGNKKNDEVDVDQTIRIYSAGQIWDSIPRRNWDPENDLNDKTKWKLDPGEVGRGYAIVDAPIDKIHPVEKLKQFKVYSVSRNPGKILKYTLHEKK